MYTLNLLLFDITNHTIGPSMNDIIQPSNVFLAAVFPSTICGVSLAAGLTSSLTLVNARYADSVRISYEARLLFRF